jgi:hypothetical protein
MWSSCANDVRLADPRAIAEPEWMYPETTELKLMRPSWISGTLHCLQGHIDSCSALNLWLALNLDKYPSMVHPIRDEPNHKQHRARLGHRREDAERLVLPTEDCDGAVNPPSQQVAETVNKK